MQRRTFLKALPAFAVLPWLAGANKELVNVFGQLPPSGTVRRVFAAGPVAAILAYVLAPEKLLGWPQHIPDEALRYLTQSASQLPCTGRLSGRSSTVSLENLVRLNPDLILDVGSTHRAYRDQAAKFSRQTGICYVLVSGHLVDSPEQLTRIGQILGVSSRGQQLAKQAHSIITKQRGCLEGSGTRFYLARGADGLESAGPGSLNSEVPEHLGLMNVVPKGLHSGTLRVSKEQVIAWKPNLILAQEPTLAEHMRRQPSWQSATTPTRIWSSPLVPFAWLDSPPGVNRLLGLLWLNGRLGTEANRLEAEKDIKAFFCSFYRHQLQPRDLEQCWA